MIITRVLKKNWLTRKPSDTAETLTALIGALVVVMTWMFWNNVIHADQWMAASPDQVFNHHEYWRLWTSLFAHADSGHMVSNAILFIPLCYFLTGFFGPVFFPVFGFFIGGLINVAALLTMSPHTSLIGISGLVYWMGAAWLTLYLLVGSRESARRRLGKTLFIAAALFAPQTFQPNVSYLAHFFGFIFGVPSALIYFYFKKETFRQAEVYEYSYEPEPEDEADSNGVVLALKDFDVTDSAVTHH